MLEELLRAASLTVHTAANLLRVLSTNPWTYSVDLEVVFPVGTMSMTVPHGLGRALNGGVITSSTYATPTFVVQTPGPGSQTHVTVLASAAPGAPVTVRLRCY